MAVVLAVAIVVAELGQIQREGHGDRVTNLQKRSREAVR
jgi:hypothetical protein